jgi:hypothetical protein
VLGTSSLAAAHASVADSSSQDQELGGNVTWRRSRSFLVAARWKDEKMEDCVLDSIFIGRNTTCLGTRRRSSYKNVAYSDFGQYGKHWHVYYSLWSGTKYLG